MKETYFVTGISTDVGKTVVAAIITQSLEADYWKPVQAGELDYTDSHKVSEWINNETSKIHESSYLLNTPMSPHGAAEIDNIEISLNKIKRPNTQNHLVIEGAGGLLVPLNSKDLVIDLIKPTDKVIIVSKHELGSINHTFLTIEALQSRNLNIAGIIFNGDEVASTESIIAEMSGVKIIGRLDPEPYIDTNVVNEYAEKFRKELTGA
ncbi:MAG: dethiobiotin synthase [Flavobacteriaceae bacterium]|nr:dethiobiotin synthase [Flavobacteriaceae bacterium]